MVFKKHPVLRNRHGVPFRMIGILGGFFHFRVPTTIEYAFLKNPP